MIRSRIARWALGLGISMAMVAAGCAGGGEDTDAASDGASSERTTADEHPFDPKTDGPGGRMRAPRLADATTIEGLEVRFPAAWTSTEPTSTMRKAQYAIPGPAGDGELAVFHFGDKGGSKEANIERWLGQFEKADGSAITEADAEMGGVKPEGLDVTTLYVEGTMKASPMMGVEKAMPGYAMLGGIVEGDGGPWFFKATGPQATMESAKATFAYMMQEVSLP